MNTYHTALIKLKKSKLIIKNEKIPLKNALNRISATDVFSPANYPACNNTAFDGFAVNSKETRLLGTVLNVINGYLQLLLVEKMGFALNVGQLDA